MFIWCFMFLPISISALCLQDESISDYNSLFSILIFVTSSFCYSTSAIFHATNNFVLFGIWNFTIIRHAMLDCCYCFLLFISQRFDFPGVARASRQSLVFQPDKIGASAWTFLWHCSGIMV
ncbi:uncharacterized protein LOC132610980 [Lycium barbarum]|uniref:uncharacterized protein LOC132610980 n=1 Tax=Lycium barbarum TaxID=112863 RepID=UPI00293E6FA8|nr:uncharacterized protein LOC132610980 [Lycium barbarum]